jgi:hypothetical protein
MPSWLPYVVAVVLLLIFGDFEEKKRKKEMDTRTKTEVGESTCNIEYVFRMEKQCMV